MICCIESSDGLVILVWKVIVELVVERQIERMVVGVGRRNGVVLPRF